MDETNDPALRSFIPVPPESHFPIQNLPYCVFRRVDQPGVRVGVGIGDMILDLQALKAHDLVPGEAHGEGPGREIWYNDLHTMLHAGPSTWREVRGTVSRLLRADEPTLRDDTLLRSEAFVPMAEAVLALPTFIFDYTDFYSSREHATNVGIMFRGAENALMPNWLHVPVAYHGRSSSIVVSGTDFPRPCGQIKKDDTATPTLGPSRALDFELELGYLIGRGNELGQRIPIAEAPEHIFGIVLVNDWSARDIQKWEYQPLGPFLGKSFCTSISPWVVTFDALEPFRVAGPVQDPPPLPYLQSVGDWAYDIHLEVSLEPLRTRQPQVICRTNAKYLYWNICQQVAHHTVNGCNLRTGDLLATGTISGPTPDSYGSLLELTWKGTKPLKLPGGETRTFLQDGDRVTMTGWCQGPGYRVGFGEVTGRIQPAYGAWGKGHDA
jgi:fumarylacetoacetase